LFEPQNNDLATIKDDQRPTVLMRIVYLECFSGMSGDMFMGALVDAGVPAKLLEDTVAALNLGARLEVSRVMRSGISATKVDVWVDGEKDMPREEYWQEKAKRDGTQSQVHQHSHSHPRESASESALNAHGKEGVSHDHEHHHEDEPSHGHEHSHGPSHEHGHSHGRGLTEIRTIISAAAVSQSAKKTAIAIFEALGVAEGKIHNMPAEKVHFHEVGAVDAIVDIICAAVGAEALSADEIICSPLNVGGGTVHCEHGTFPVPAPATLELLKGVPMYSSGVQAELVTPTGAAIVKTLASRFAAFPQMIVETAGYGAGSRDFHGHPNVVRLTVGTAAASAADSPIESKTAESKTAAETITVLEANLDDLNPQVFGYVMDRLLEDGALDVFAIPVQMKKNRPGMLLTVLCKPADASRFTKLIFAETTTLGVRRRDEVRQVLARRWESVQTPWGDVRIKIGSMNGSVTNYAPEYEDCRKIAVQEHLPLKTVMQEATRLYSRTTEKN
jgi:pyridinium-3,5-bisthiocarboxylic acid mononucleotide nickel chelatase